MKISDLFARGAIVQVHVATWTACTRIICSDLDIPDTEAVKKALALGSHRMAPTEAFEEIKTAEREAKAAVAEVSLPFSMIPSASYVPEERLEGLAVKLKQHRTAFEKAVNDFCERYDTIRAEWKPTIIEALKTALGSDVAADAVFGRIEAEYPTAFEVRRRYSLRWYVYTLQSVSKGAAAALSNEGSEVRSILRGMVEGLRNDVQEKVAAVMAILAKGGKIQKRTIESAMAVLDRAEQMNLLGDDELALQVTRLREILRSVTPESDGEAIVAGLEDVATALRADIDAAVVEAERNLTGLGRRRIQAA